MMAIRLLVGLPLAGVAQPRDELDEALAVPVVGRVAHEAAEIALRVAHHRVVVLQQRVVVDVDDAGVGDRLVLEFCGPML